jgi:hypothetical protein
MIRQRLGLAQRERGRSAGLANGEVYILYVPYQDARTVQRRGTARVHATLSLSGAQDAYRDGLGSGDEDITAPEFFEELKAAKLPGTEVF